MKIAVISDIHANLPALEAVFAALDDVEPDMVFCLGDLVGYAPWPNEVIALVRSRGVPTIAGNYDEGVGLNSQDCGCAYRTDADRALGAQSIAFTNRVVSDGSRGYLRSLPRHLRLDFGTGAERFSVLMVHGSPRKINEYLFEDRADASYRRIMNDAHADMLLFGHTHKPFTRLLPENDNDQTRGLRIVNTGSVGKPKDGDPRACAVLLELPDGAEINAASVDVKFVRVAYDVERAAAAIEATPELPSAFAEMLRNGG